MILAGDIGGTKTVLALFEPRGPKLREVAVARYASRSYASFDGILSDFLDQHARPPVRATCLGVAGPVIEGRCSTTNLPWQLDEQHLSSETGGSPAKLLNDLQATAFGSLHLDDSDLAPLQGTTMAARPGNVAVLAAGTGLGEAILYWDGQRHHPIATEGGHADFAPRSEREFELFRFLRSRLGGRVSCERVVSGPGLVDVFRFLLERDGCAAPPWWPTTESDEQAAPEITRRALSDGDPRATEALEIFTSAYGAEAGNLALKCFATGGVVLAGGIAPKIIDFLRRGSFLSALVDKGRFAPFLRSLSVAVVLNQETPLLGAAHFAHQFADGRNARGRRHRTRHSRVRHRLES